MATTEFRNNVAAPTSVSVNGTVIRSTSGIPLASSGADGDLHIDAGAETSPGYRPAILQRQDGVFRAVAG